ncbi:MAG TPA: hypothetical protein VNP94_06125 [Actinomycetota bacterium]|nr:hypothetical protein [Actinomycetota bacterium]
MGDVGYVIAAYLGAALLYGAYALHLLRRERALEGRARERPR